MTAESRLDSRPVRSPGAALERKTRRTLIRSGDGGVVVSVNTSAAALFELCDGATTVGEMVTAVCDASSIPLVQAEGDVLRTLDELEKSGLIIFE